MLTKTIQLNDEELPETLKVQLSQIEYDFIKEHSGVKGLPKAVVDGETLSVELSTETAAAITHYTGSLNRKTSPNPQVGSEIYEALSSIFNLFYDSGYKEAL